MKGVRRAPTEHNLRKGKLHVSHEFPWLDPRRPRPGWRSGAALLQLAQRGSGRRSGSYRSGSYNDDLSQFVITLPSAAFTSNGTFDQWSVYVNRPGTLGLLILNGPNATPTVVRSLFQNTTAGLNTFNLGLALSVSSGDYLGIWMGIGGKVDYDPVADATTPYSLNDAYSSIPGVGTQLITESFLGMTSRNYSINVRFTEAASTVSEPGMLALVGLSLVGLAVTRRRSAR